MRAAALMSEAKRLRREMQMQVQRCGESEFSFFLSLRRRSDWGQRLGFRCQALVALPKALRLLRAVPTFPAKRGASMRMRQAQTQPHARETRRCCAAKARACAAAGRLDAELAGAADRVLSRRVRGAVECNARGVES